MLEGGGYEVIDLGVNVPAEKFVEAVQKDGAQAVLMSALITLTMESMRRTIQALESGGLRKSVIVGVGGAPVTQKFAGRDRRQFLQPGRLWRGRALQRLTCLINRKHRDGPARQFLPS